MAAGWLENTAVQGLLKTLEHYENYCLAVIPPPHLIDTAALSDSYLGVVAVEPLVVYVDERRLELRAGHFLLLNPGQGHRILHGATLAESYLVMIEKNHLRDTYQTLSGNRVEEFSNGPFGLSQDCEYLIKSFIRESKERRPGMTLAQEGIASLLIVSFLRRVLAEEATSEESPIPKQHAANIERSKEFLRSEMATEFSLRRTAHAAGLSPYYFLRVFKEYTGRTPYEYLVELRLHRARTLLETTDSSVKEICFACGFVNTSHFATLFRKRTGTSPTTYRSRSRAN